MARPVKIILNIFSDAGLTFSIVKMNFGWNTKMMAKLKSIISTVVNVDSFIICSKSSIPFLGPLSLLYCWKIQKTFSFPYPAIN